MADFYDGKPTLTGPHVSDPMTRAAYVMFHPETTREQRQKILCTMVPRSRSSDYYKPTPGLVLLRKMMREEGLV